MGDLNDRDTNIVTQEGGGAASANNYLSAGLDHLIRFIENVRITKFIYRNIELPLNKNIHDALGYCFGN